MHEITVVNEGLFPITVTPDLRKQFADKHDEMSGSNPDDEQFPIEEQLALRYICYLTPAGEEWETDPVKIEDNLLELIHYLHESGFTIPLIIPAVRCFSGYTRSVAMRLHIHAVDERKKAAKEYANSARAYADSLFSHAAPAYA